MKKIIKEKKRNSRQAATTALNIIFIPEPNVSGIASDSESGFQRKKKCVKIIKKEK